MAGRRRASVSLTENSAYWFHGQGATISLGCQHCPELAVCGGLSVLAEAYEPEPRGGTRIQESRIMCIMSNAGLFEPTLPGVHPKKCLGSGERSKLHLKNAYR